MTKKHLIASILCLVIVAVIVIVKFTSNGIPLLTETSDALKSKALMGFQDMVGTQTIQRAPASIGYVNMPSTEWQTNLEKTLKNQGGIALKEIDIKKVESLVWIADQNRLHVESVIVTLKNQQNEKTSFRALVDSQTGKVLETWDRTIVDPIDPRSNFRFKLDSRYSN